MPTVTETFLDSREQPLVGISVVIESVTGPKTGADGLVSRSRIVAITDFEGEISVELSGGKYRAIWSSGTVRNEIIFDVPETGASYHIGEQQAASNVTYTSGTIYWGASAAETLDGAGITALGNSMVRSRLSAALTLPAGGYKYLAWPDALGSPKAVSGILDSDSGLPLAMASAADGYAEAQNGWHFRLVSLAGVVHRLYRSKYKLGGSVPVVISPP